MKEVKCDFCDNLATNQDNRSFYHYSLCDKCGLLPEVQELVANAEAEEKYADKQDEHYFEMAYGSD